MTKPRISRRDMIARAACAAGSIRIASDARAAAPPNAIRFIQGNHLGTSYDRYGRVFISALTMSRPSMRIVVEPNSRAAGRLAARQLADAPPDGGTIGSFPTALAYAELLGDDGVAFELAKLGWIGSFNVEPRLLVVSARLGVASLDELRARPLAVAVGADTTTSVGAREPLLLNSLLGMRLRPVMGYSSPAGAPCSRKSSAEASSSAWRTTPDSRAMAARSSPAARSTTPWR